MFAGCTTQEGTAMKYLCLVYAEENALAAAINDRECKTFSDPERTNGRIVSADALHPVSTATTVRVRDGKVSTTDGPFAETKEQLAGYYLIEAKDLDDAMRFAARIPPARVGSIEVRPVRDLVVT
jgi:hypothetical protein